MFLKKMLEWISCETLVPNCDSFENLLNFTKMVNASESPIFAFVFKTTENEQVKFQNFSESAKDICKVQFVFLKQPVRKIFLVKS